MLLTNSLPLACPTPLLTTQAYIGMRRSQCAGPSYQLTIKEMPPDMPTGQSDGGNFSDELSFLLEHTDIVNPEICERKAIHSYIVLGQTGLTD